MKYPELTKYNSLLQMVDSDDDRKDTSEFFKHLRNFTIMNPRIRGHINMRQTAITSWGWQIESLNNQDTTEISARLYQSIDLILRAICDFALFGKLLINLNWQYDPQLSLWTPIAKKIPPENYEILNDGSFALRNGKNLIIIPNDSMDYIGLIDDEGKIGGIMRAVGTMEIIRNQMTLEWANYNLKLKGIIQGIDKGTDEQERATAEQALQTAIQHNYLLTSDLIDFNFHQITANGAGQSFKDLLEYLNNSIAIAILGQANTVELPKATGSRAALQVMATISADIMWADIELATRTINDKLLKFDYFKNTGQTNTVPYKFEISSVEPEDAESNIIVIREALAAGIPLSRDEIYQKIGFNPPREGGDIINGGLET